MEKKTIEAGTTQKFLEDINHNFDELYERAEGTKDYIVDSGIVGSWTYRKWNSGEAECYGYILVTPTQSIKSGVIYHSDLISITLPIQMNGAVFNVFLNDYLEWAVNATFSSQTNTIAFRVARGEPITTKELGARIIVKGKWK